MKKLFYLLFSLLTVTLVSCENSKEPSDSANGHEYIDLGLSVKWATCNVGANSPEKFGNYYAWGEIETKTDYSTETYKWNKGKSDTYTKYCILQAEGTVDNKITLELSDDAASANWGGNWRMPNAAEMQELVDECTWMWGQKDNVKGFTVIGRNGNSIFLPTAGFFSDSNLEHVNTIGSYATNTLCSLYSQYINALYFEFGGEAVTNVPRETGYSIRPVLP